VTHKLYILPEVDYIVWMENGRVSAHGTYQNLMTENPAFQTMMKEHGGAGGEEEHIAKEETDVVKYADRPQRKLSVENEETTAKGLMTVEEKSQGSVSSYIYRYYLTAAGPFAVVSFLMFSVLLLTQVLRIGNDLWLALWSRNSQPHQQGDPFSFTLPLTGWIGIYIGLGIAQGIAQLSNGIAFAWIGLAASKKMHNNMLHHVLRAPMSFFDTTPLGRILNRYSDYLA
jgi:ABC-type multidrug transport system fused ATPase/permease subunit